MKIRTTVTEIKCTADDLRQSSSLSEGFLNMLRNCFNGTVPTVTEEEQEDGNDE